MLRPVHFEIHASDPARATRFHEASFGWKFHRHGPVGRPEGHGGEHRGAVPARAAEVRRYFPGSKVLLT
jgi:predicted enzyme related to lactoylglutathione lyase